jgi:hypothetical protein
MNTTNSTPDLTGWLREQVKTVNEAIQSLEKSHNYGKATLCEGMREAYMQCLKRLEAA